MLYEKFVAYKLQIKGEEQRESIQVYPDHNGIDDEGLAKIFPI